MELQRSKANQAKGVFQGHDIKAQSPEKSTLGLDDLRAIFKDFNTGYQNNS